MSINPALLVFGVITSTVAVLGMIGMLLRIGGWEGRTGERIANMERALERMEASFNDKFDFIFDELKYLRRRIDAD